MSRLFGWCQANDAHHANCRVSLTDHYGRTHVCSCPEHENEEK